MKTDLSSNKKTEFNQHMLKCLTDTEQKLYAKMLLKEKKKKHAFILCSLGLIITLKVMRTPGLRTGRYKNNNLS